MPYKKRHHMSKVARSKTHRCSLTMQEHKVSSAVYCRTSGRRGELEVVVNSCCGVNLWLWHGFPTAAGKGFFQAGSYTMCKTEQRRVLGGSSSLLYSELLCRINVCMLVTQALTKVCSMEIHFMLVLMPHQWFADAGAQANFFLWKNSGYSLQFRVLSCTTPQKQGFKDSKLIQRLELCFSDNVQIKDTSYVVLTIFK